VPRSQAVGIGRRSYANMGRSLMEYTAFARLSAGDVAELVELNGKEHFERAFAGGKGVVLFTAHLGNWELMGARFAAEGYPTDFLVGEQSNKLVDDMMNELRRAQNIGIIHRNVALRGVLRALKDNRMVCLLGDQNVLSGGVFVDFFGRTASTARGPALFAIKQGCPIVVAGVRRIGRGRHVATADKTLWPDPELDGEEAIVELTQRFTDAISEHIRRAPDEYFWAHRRWKTRPPHE